MRLTLRTLLAYLDDTLEPSEAKSIGEKVSESDVAPDLIERIKRVTRRRGLAAPPVTGDEDGTSDPNTVAEYLDNVLPSDQIAEVEEAGLTSDSHLAEVAACHQILTLVLGEPAKVPPTARQRMYRLVKGPEAIPYRRPAPASLVAGVAEPDHEFEENHEADEALLLGMKSTRLLIPIAAAGAIVLLLVGVIMFAIPSAPPRGTQGFISLNIPARSDTEPKVDQKVAEQKKKKDAYDQFMARGRAAQTAKNWDVALEDFKSAQAVFPADATVAQAIKDVEKAKADAATGNEVAKALAAAIQRARDAIKAKQFDEADKALADAIKIDVKHPEIAKLLVELADARDAVAKKAPVVAELAPMPREAGSKPILTPQNEPDTNRRAVGRLASRDALVLNRARGTDKWEQVEALKDLLTTDTIMALPGNRADLRLDNGVVLTLWGSLPQFQTIPVLDVQESRIIVHVPPQGFDTDFTLEGGRVFIARPIAQGKKAEPVRVRIRFKEEVWEITLLDADTEVCVDLLGFYPEGVPFSKEKNGPAPKAEFYFGLLRGRAGLKVRFKEYPMLQAPIRADWDSISGEVSAPEKIRAEDMEWWNRKIPENPEAAAMQAAAAYFAEQVKKSESTVEIVFNSAMKDEKEQINRRAYSVYCLQAMDSISFLADSLELAEAPDVAQRFDLGLRRFGIQCVQHWTGQAAERDLQVYRTLIDKKNYTEAQAQMVMQLMHLFREDDLRKPEIVAALFDLTRNERLAIRELAYFHLTVADSTGAREVGVIDMSVPEEARDPMIAKWKASYKKRMIDKKK